MPLIEDEPPSTLPRVIGMTRSRAALCGTDLYPQSTSFFSCGVESIAATAPGSSSRFLIPKAVSLPPASITITLAPLSASLRAVAQPALPAPTTM